MMAADAAKKIATRTATRVLQLRSAAAATIGPAHTFTEPRRNVRRRNRHTLHSPAKHSNIIIGWQTHATTYKRCQT